MGFNAGFQVQFLRVVQQLHMLGVVAPILFQDYQSRMYCSTSELNDVQ